MTTRLTADERREAIIAAARVEYADGGYAGTPTEAIARRAGVSQPYVFQLFGTKRELFVAAIGVCFQRTNDAFVAAGKPAKDAALGPKAILEAMGHGYIRLLMQDPNVLRLQLQAYAACADPDIRLAVRANWRRLWQTVCDVSGADDAAVRDWFAQGMLINVVASIGEGTTFEDYLTSLVGGAPDHC